jgi:hypothetical protein
VDPEEMVPRVDPEEMVPRVDPEEMVPRVDPEETAPAASVIVVHNIELNNTEMQLGGPVVHAQPLVSTAAIKSSSVSSKPYGPKSASVTGTSTFEVWCGHAAGRWQGMRALSKSSSTSTGNGRRFLVPVTCAVIVGRKLSCGFAQACRRAAAPPRRLLER